MASASALLPAVARGGGGGADDAFRRCLVDDSCLRRLTDVVGGAVNASNSSNSTNFDMPIRPQFLELLEPDRAVDVGNAGDQAGKITLGMHTAVRGVATAALTSSSASLGWWVGPILVKVALLAFANGLVIDPPAERADVTYQVLWVDTCKDLETAQNTTTKCISPYALKLVEPLIFGRSASAAPAHSYVPPVRALVGGTKWTTYVASLAGSQGLPSVGFAEKNAALSDKFAYPSFVRCDPTERLTFAASLAVLEELQFTVVDVLACNMPTTRDSATSFMQLASAAGVSATQFLVQPDPYTAWPAGGDLDGPLGGVRDVAHSLRKKAQWDGLIAGMKAFNAHAHVTLSQSDCPYFDVMHYLAMFGGFSGGGHIWLGFLQLQALYESVYVFTITTLRNPASPYTSVVPFDDFIMISADATGSARAAFWELMAYIGTRQEEFLGPELANRIPASAFVNPSSYNWLPSITEYAVDAAFTVLRAINDVILEEGEGFSNAQLLAKIMLTDFQGITGRVRLDAVGDRIQDQQVLQYRFPPGTTRISSGLHGEAVKVAAYSTSLTPVAPFLFKAGGGRKATPPPDRDLDCGVGMRYDRSTGSCVACLPGTFAARGGLAECEPCVPGSYAPGNGSSSCTPCPEGFAAPIAGSTNCTACEPGWFNSDVQQSACHRCERGTYAGAGARLCALCPAGAYAESQGQERCDLCNASFTTYFVGSTSAEDCICPAGWYRDAGDRGVCHRCPDGMQCGLGCDAAELALVLGGVCTGVGDDCVIPLASPRYMTRKEEPLRSFLCLTAEACPGGPPGTCGALRNNEQVACGRCLLGAHKDKKRCVPCTGGVSTVGVVVVVLVMVALLVAAVFVGNRNLILESNSSLSMMVLFGITLSSIQTLGVFRNLSLEWFEPLASIFSALQLLSFNIDFLNIECIVQPNPATMYLFRQLAGPFALVVLLAAILAKKWRRPQVDVLVEYMNSAGTVFGAMFISIASSCVLPLICYPHPGNNGESLLSDPTVLCWVSRDHVWSVVIGALTFAVVLVPFIAVLVYGTVRHHELVAQSVRGKGRGLSAFRFLFYRFRPEAYMYGSILMAKGLLICLVPVAIRHDVAFQVCVMTTILLLCQGLQLELQPWRSVLANVVDGAGTALLVLFLVCGSAGADLSANLASIRLLGSIIFACLCASVVVGAGVCVVRYLRPTPFFRWFACHHKRDAGAQARLLQIMFQLANQTCFIDSDDLKDLDQLFDLVKCAVGHLLVYLTRDVLTRPWCSGEIATTVKKGTRMTAILTPSWVDPSVEEISAEGLPEYLDLTSTTLHQYSISFESISSAYAHLLSDRVPKVQAADGLRGQARMHSVVGQLLKRSSMVGSPPQPHPGMLVISSDPKDDEATAAAGILASYVQRALFSFMSEGALLLADGGAPDDGKVREAVWNARAVTVVLSKDSLASEDQLKVVTFCMGRLRARKFSSNAGRLPAFEVIPLTTPTFVFPSNDFYSLTLPKIWTDVDLDAKDVGLCLRSFFKRLAVNFSTHASSTVLETQAQHLVDRVPKKWQSGGGGAADDIRELSIKSVRSYTQSANSDGSQVLSSKDSQEPDPNFNPNPAQFSTLAFPDVLAAFV